jgi:4a-hydroxytetrahydrobiopterin dehydratase
MPTPRKKAGTTTTGLAARDCVPCRGGVPALGRAVQKVLLAQIHRDWRIVDAHHLERDLRFPDFATALAFVNRVGALAESQGHHPDVDFGWGRVRISIWTHAIDGLTESDFVLAAKIDRLPLTARATGRRATTRSRSRRS